MAAFTYRTQDDLSVWQSRAVCFYLISNWFLNKVVSHMMEGLRVRSVVHNNIWACFITKPV